MNLPNSLWAEPSLSSLIEQIELLLDMPKEKIVSKLKYAKEFISSNYSWQKVAQTIQNSLNNYDTFEKQEPNIGLIAISDTNSPIANYLEQLLEKFNKTNLTVFADLADTTLKEDKNLESLKEKIIQRNINSIIIQYDASFFSLSTLGELLTFCTQNNIQTYLFIHSIKDAKTLLGLSKELQSVTRIMVQAIEHLNTLKEFGIYQNSSLFKHINSQRFYDMLTALR